MKQEMIYRCYREYIDFFRSFLIPETCARYLSDGDVNISLHNSDHGCSNLWIYAKLNDKLEGKPVIGTAKEREENMLSATSL